MRSSNEVFKALREVALKESREQEAAVHVSEASTDPADEAYDRVQGYPSLLGFIEKGLDAVRKEWEHAKKMTDGAKRYGGQHIMALDLLSGGPLRSLQDLRDDVNDAISTVERIVKEGSRGRGMIGARTEANGNGEEEDESLADTIERLVGWNRVIAKLDGTESDIKKAVKAAEGKDFQEVLLQMSLALEQLGDVAGVGTKLTGQHGAESAVKRASNELVYLRRGLK